jgi:hypothetical protein
MCDNPFVVLDFEYTPMEHVIIVTKLVHWNQVLIWGLCELSISGAVLTHVFKFKEGGLDLIRHNIYFLLDNTILLFAIHKFNPNPILVNINCCNPSLGFTTKARACESAGQEWSPRVTFHTPGSVGECEGMNPTLPSELSLCELESWWTFEPSEGNYRG